MYNFCISGHRVIQLCTKIAELTHKKNIYLHPSTKIAHRGHFWRENSPVIKSYRKIYKQEIIEKSENW